MTSIDEARRMVAVEECKTTGHDLEHVLEAITFEPTALFCPRCGRSWPVGARPAPAAPEEVAGYVVVATADGGDPRVARWMSPGRYETVERAEAEREFWQAGKHLRSAGLRLAKLALLAKDDQAASGPVRHRHSA